MTFREQQVCVYGFPSLPQPHVPQQTCQNDFQARVAKNFQSHLNIYDYLEEVWQPTVTLYWNIWNSRKIILMSPKKEKLYYSKLWRKKKKRGKISFSNHKCVSVSSLKRSSSTLQNIFTFFFYYYQLTKNYTHGAKKGEWMTHFVELLVLFLDLLISLLASVHFCSTNHFFGGIKVDQHIHVKEMFESYQNGF